MDLREFITVAGITPDKKKDQHFLVDSQILDAEAALLQLTSEDVVLEVGAGFGALTIRLGQKCRVLAVEIDPALVEYLRKIKNVVAMNNDIMKILEEARRDQRLGTFSKVAGNIPYSRSQDIVLELLRHPWKRAVLCVQKEFAHKIVKEHSKLACVVQECCQVAVKMQVPAGKFYPAAVDSSVLVLTQKKLLDEGYLSFLEKLFKSRNKNIGNVFAQAPVLVRKKKATQLSKIEIKKLYDALQSSARVRGK